MGSAKTASEITRMENLTKALEVIERSTKKAAQSYNGAAKVALEDAAKIINGCIRTIRAEIPEE